MEREDGSLALVARSIACGAIAWIAVLVLTWLLAVGPTPAGSPETVGRLLVDAHQPLTSGPIGDLDPLTWFELPPTVLYLLPPLLLVSAGIAAGRLTTVTDLRIGAYAGLAVVVGYVPPLAAVAFGVDADVGLVVLIAAAIALACGAIGGVVGVRT